MKQWLEHTGMEQSGWEEKQSDYEMSGLVLVWVVGMEKKETNQWKSHQILNDYERMKGK